MSPVWQYTTFLESADAIGLALSGLPFLPDMQWWFWDETWTDAYGPYPSKAEAEAACAKYAREVLG